MSSRTDIPPRVIPFRISLSFPMVSATVFTFPLLSFPGPELVGEGDAEGGVLGGGAGEAGGVLHLLEGDLRFGADVFGEPADEAGGGAVGALFHRAEGEAVGAGQCHLKIGRREEEVVALNGEVLRVGAH